MQVGHGVGAADPLATGFLMVPGAAAFAGWHFHPASAADSDDLDFGNSSCPHLGEPNHAEHAPHCAGK